MASRVTVSVKSDQEELLEWVDERVEEGVFRSRSHAFCRGLEELKDSEVNQFNV